jgi:hypothetical protein
MANTPAKVENKDLVNEVPDFLRDMLAEDMGKGVSNRPEDYTIPLIYVLQANSPQCNKRGPDYVEGAEAGSIWLRKSGLPAVSGEDGILFQPCEFQVDWVEWRPNRGGFAGRHPTKPEDAVWTKRPKENDPDHHEWVLPNGNSVQETRYHIGNVLWGGQFLPYVIPLTSSGHTVSKDWMTLIKNQGMEGVKGSLPSFACIYRLRTKQVTNAKGTWMKFDVTFERKVQTADEVERGRALHDSFASGEKGIDEDEVDQGSHASHSSSVGGDSAPM